MMEDKDSKNIQQDQLYGWDPDKARIVGTFKVPVDFKTTDIDVEIKVEFSEPKAKVTENRKPKVVDVNKRNKKSLF